jgi:hypothetical protein
LGTSCQSRPSGYGDRVGVAEGLGCLPDAAKTLMDSVAKCRQLMRHILGKYPSRSSKLRTSAAGA